MTVANNPFYDELERMQAPKKMLEHAKFRGRKQFVEECNNPAWLIWLAEQKQNEPGWISTTQFRTRFILSVTTTAILSLFFLKKLGKSITVWTFKPAIIRTKKPALK